MLGNAKDVHVMHQMREEKYKLIKGPAIEIEGFFPIKCDSRFRVRVNDFI